MSGILLCNVQDGKMSTKKVDLPPSSTVKRLLDTAAAFVSFSKEHITLTYQGQVLDKSAKIDQCGMKPGALVMVVAIPPPPPVNKEKTPAVAMKPEDVKKFSLAFKSAFKNHPVAFKKVVKRLLVPENMENLAAACPGLSQDLIGQAFLTQPELLLHLLDPATLTKVGEEHPSILEAANNLAAAVHEEQASTVTTSEGGASGSYYLDDMDDEEQDMEGGEEGGAMRGPMRSRSFNAITPNMLAQALASAAGQSSPAGSSVNQNPFQGVTGLGPAASQSSGTEGGTPSRLPRITTDFFQAAMQQALQASLGTAMDQQTSGDSDSSDMSEQVARMREIMGGHMDESLAVRALQIMGGDIQAAVDLMFSGWEGGDDSMQ